MGILPTTSSPMKQNLTEMSSEQEIFFSTIEILEDKDDTKFFLPEYIKEENILSNEKFVVYLGMLDCLIGFIRCPKCLSLAAETPQISKLGTDLFCESEHLIVNWKSQPLTLLMTTFFWLVCEQGFESTTLKIF